MNMEPMEVSEKNSSTTTSATTSSKTPSLSLSTATSTSDMLISESGKKRKKLSTDERLNRNRERNRIHARKTRERKKFQTTAIQNRIHQLYEEGRKLRQMIDERYTASSLLGLSKSPQSKLESDQKVPLVPSTSICDNYYENIISENNWIKDTNGNPYFQPAQVAKRVRRTGKLNPQEREQLRRERNRMHAKKTRDRKKFYLEMSDKIISEMETESKSLREYLLQIGMISQEDYQQRTLKDLKAKQEIDNFKLTSMDDGDIDGASEQEDEDEEDDEDNEDNGETASENENPEREERSPSGSSDENEKVSSWSRSSASSNPGSSGAQSMDFTSSKSHSSSNTDTAKMSSSNYTTNDAKSSNASSDSFQDKRSGDNSSGSDERDSPDYNANGMMMNDNEWNEGDEYRARDDPSSDRSTEAPESYHHGRKRKVVKVVVPETSNSFEKDNGENNIEDKTKTPIGRDQNENK